MNPHPQFGRSTNDRVLAGVCSGMAHYLGLPTLTVRVIVLLSALPFSLVVGFVYVTAAFVLPPTETAERPLSTDWQADSLRLTWKGPISPYLLPWPHVVSALGVLAGALAIYTTFRTFTATGEFATALDLRTVLLPMVPLGLVVWLSLRAPYKWALTLSHGALWIERPIKGAERIELTQIDGFHPHRDPFAIHLRGGRTVAMAPPPSAPELDVLIEELGRSIARAEDHEAVLDASSADRERLERMRESSPE